MSPRTLQAEWLDELPPGDVRAIRSRADLRRVNALMGNARLVASVLRRHLEAGPGVLALADLGAGDGTLALAVARRLRRPRVRLTLVDRAPVVHGVTLERLDALGWHAGIAAADVFDFLSAGEERYDALFANLFLHHFDDARLARLLAAAAARTRLFVACEPRRSALAAAGSRLLWALGCNEVTRHDARVSVRAGFVDGELSAAWPKGASWRIDERAAFPFSHLFSACAATRS
ncbi:MAG TPA: methyltransferase domain-containing protein [Burkholderiales bacterium]